jgi:glutamyl-Q tRNA(Asp) synthetase
VASFADARRAGGSWLVRIEDVDVPRARPRAAENILRTLEDYGFEWDEPVTRQSAQIHAYEAALADLAARGVAYPCACTRRELAAQPTSRIGERIYPGTCRAGVPKSRAASTQLAIRVRVPSAPIAFDDRVFGRIEQRLDGDVGDFVVRRSDGLFAYQLAVVVDDAAQGITDVVRGADLLASTPRQIFLQHTLGVATPRYLHVPVAVDARGAKLSKAPAATALPASPLPALVAAWRFLNQPAAPGTAVTVREFWTWAIANWDVERIPRVSSREATASIV